LTAGSTSTPAIVRLAGMTSDLLAGLPWEKASGWAEALGLRKALRELRSEVAAALYREVPLHAPRQRRLLLNLRRDCHNGRGVAGHLPEVLRVDLRSAGLPSLLQRLRELEQQARETEDAYASEYALRHRREVEILTRPLRNAALRRGLALASPSFSAEIDSLHGGRAIQTLARYMTRVAFKLSPYSTLTPAALAEIKPSSGAVRYIAGTRTTASSLRVQRYLVDQWCEILRRLPAVRPHLRVRLNTTVSRVSEDRYRFLRPPQLLAKEGSPALTYSRYVQVTVRIGGSLPPLLLARAPQGSLLQLVRELEIADPEAAPEDLSRGLDQLIELGFLTLLLPVPPYHPHFERALLGFLSTLPPSPPLPEVSLFLDEIIRLEETYATAPAPGAVATRVEAAVEDLYQAAHRQLPGGGPVPLQKEPRHNLYEDCFEVSAAVPTGAVLEFDERSLREAVDAANLVWQIASLQEARHELLLTLDEFLNQRFPGPGPVPLLDLFDLFRPLWEEYLAFLAEEQRPATFNPLALATVADLADLRLRLTKSLEAIVRSSEEGEHYPVDELRQIVAGLPPRWRNPLGPSLFLQPADPEASAWVMNRIFEGNGRMSSRYTTVMPERIRDSYLGHYRLRSTLDVEGEPAELLDLQYTKMNTSSVHLPQTSKVLLLPGELLDPRDAQAVEPRELFVRRTPDRSLAIVDAQGNRLIPSFLSPIASPFLPSIVKFLECFGCCVRNSYNFPARSTSSQGIIRTRRQRVGNLVVKRASWKLDRAVVPSPELKPRELFLEVQRWRLEAGLPREAYMIEQDSAVAFRGEIFKPQYVRFDSVTLVEILHESLRKKSGPLVLVEALPRAGDFPADPELGRRAVEIIVEWLALTPIDKSRSRSPEGEIHQPAEPWLPATQEIMQ